MSTLEGLISTAGEQPLQSSLDYTLPAASTSITDRRQHVRAYPTSASTLSPTGTKTCRIRLGGDDFVDASSVRLMFTINETGNAAGKILKPTCGPWGCWGQVYLRSNGVELDSIPYYGRHHEFFGFRMLPMAEQFGEAGIAGLSGSYNSTFSNLPTMGTIAQNGSYTVMHRLALSLFNSGKLLPCRFAPIECELSLAPVADWLAAESGTSSNTYTISNIQILYDSYQLDASVQESYYKALLNSRVLTIPTMTVYQTVHSIPAGSSSYSFAAVRAFSRLSHVWLTFRKDGAKSSSFICPTTIANNNGPTPALSDVAPYCRLSVGPHFYPDSMPVTSIPEHFYQLQKAMGSVPNLDRDDFIANCFSIVFDLRRLPSDPTSSISTRSGDLLRVDLTNITPDVATEVYLTLVAFSVTSIRESGVTLLT